jgi:hypothetical protein
MRKVLLKGKSSHLKKKYRLIYLHPWIARLFGKRLFLSTSPKKAF